jgi:hypothetical protein
VRLLWIGLCGLLNRVEEGDVGAERAAWWLSSVAWLFDGGLMVLALREAQRSQLVEVRLGVG